MTVQKAAVMDELDQLKKNDKRDEMASTIKKLKVKHRCVTAQLPDH
jgi:hypothetical protein